MHVVGPRRAGLLHERAEDPLVARQRAGVGRRRDRAGRGRADLQDRDADVALGRPRERGGQAGPVAVGLQEERDRPDAVLLDQRGEERRGVDHRLVADRRDRVEGEAAPDRERVDRHVPALRHERDPAGRTVDQRVAPQRRAAVEGDHAVAVRADHGQMGGARGRDELGLQRAAARLAEARREHHEPAAAAPPGRAHDLGHARGGDRDDDGVDGLRQIVERRHAGPPVDLAARRVHAVHRPGEAERGEVAQRRVAVGAGPVARAHDRDRARPQQRAEVERARGHGLLRGAQRSTFATPRRSSERATISRWISLVPSQMRSTRSSRRNRSATLSRR